ncbi:MAG: hypothetical protein PHO53_07050 [Actinomycetota bacterium]|nr:hypothetical protein [Actinomycetota bacterium]
MDDFSSFEDEVHEVSLETQGPFRFAAETISVSRNVRMHTFDRFQLCRFHLARALRTVLGTDKEKVKIA